MCLDEGETDGLGAEGAGVIGFGALQPARPKPELANDAYLRKIQRQQAGHPVDVGWIPARITSASDVFAQRALDEQFRASRANWW